MAAKTSNLSRGRLWSVLERFEGNPILRPEPTHCWESKAVFNPAAIYEGGKVHILYRALGDTDTSVIGYVSSSDGFHIDERLDPPTHVPWSHLRVLARCARLRLSCLITIHIRRKFFGWVWIPKVDQGGPELMRGFIQLMLRMMDVKRI